MSCKDRKQMLKRFIICVWIEPCKAIGVYRIPLPKDAKRPAAKEFVLALDEPVDLLHVCPPGDFCDRPLAVPLLLCRSLHLQGLRY